MKGAAPSKNKLTRSPPARPAAALYPPAECGGEALGARSGKAFRGCFMEIVISLLPKRT